MPLFFFDIANHQFVRRAHRGRDFASLEAARAAGHGELRDWLTQRRLVGGHWLEIRDADGALLARLESTAHLVEKAEPEQGDAPVALLPMSDLLLAILALRRTLARLAAHGEEDAEDSQILELLKAAYAERLAAQIARATAPRP